MVISELCQRDVVTVHASDELVGAAELMRQKHVGYLIVVEPERSGPGTRVAGVLTDRDIVVTVVARGVDARSLTVGDVMTRNPVTVAESDPLDRVLVQMRRAGVRRVPVVGAHNQLAGILALDDVIDALSDELQNIASSMRNERRIEGTLRP